MARTMITWRIRNHYSGHKERQQIQQKIGGVIVLQKQPRGEHQACNNNEPHRAPPEDAVLFAGFPKQEEKQPNQKCNTKQNQHAGRSALHIQQYHTTPPHSMPMLIGVNFGVYWWKQ